KRWSRGSAPSGVAAMPAGPLPGGWSTADGPSLRHGVPSVDQPLTAGHTREPVRPSEQAVTPATCVTLRNAGAGAIVTDMATCLSACAGERAQAAYVRPLCGRGTFRRAPNSIATRVGDRAPQSSGGSNAT